MPKLGLTHLAPKLQWPKYFYQGFNRQYFRKHLALRPYAFWPLWEASGSTIYDISGNGLHGAYTSVTLGAAGPDGKRTCPYLDGSASIVSVLTTGLKAAFDGSLISVVAWAKFTDWGDGDAGFPFHFQVDANNFIRVLKHSDDKIYFVSKAGGTEKSTNEDASGYSGWYFLAITRNETDDETKFYRYWNNGANGGQIGATQTSIGAFSSSDLTIALIGAGSAAPSNVVDGWQAYAALYDTCLSAAQLLSLARP